MESSLRSAERMNMPCGSPLTSFTKMSVTSPRSRVWTIGDHSLVAKDWRSLSSSSMEYWPSLSNS